MQLIYNDRQNTFNDAMIYLIEHNVFAVKNGKMIFISENIPEEQLNVHNSKTKMIIHIKKICEKMLECQ